MAMTSMNVVWTQPHVCTTSRAYMALVKNTAKQTSLYYQGHALIRLGLELLACERPGLLILPVALLLR